MKDPFRVYVYTRHGLGIPAPDIQTELTAIHGDASPSLRTIFRWIAEIKSGTFEYQKKSGPGRPVSSTTPEKIREIKSEIEQNCRLSCRELSTIVNLDKSAVYNVLTQHLDLRNVFSVWVPHTLSISNKQQRVDCAIRILKMFAIYPSAILCTGRKLGVMGHRAHKASLDWEETGQTYHSQAKAAH